MPNHTGSGHDELPLNAADNEPEENAGASGQGGTLADQIRHQLDGSHMKRAATLLLDAWSAGTIASDGNAGQWVNANVSEGAAGKISGAIARTTSPCCERGFVTCPTCGGFDLSSDQFCSDCMGLGVRRCDFCDGTGLLQYSGVPADLIPKVALLRLQRVAELVEDAVVTKESTRDLRKLRTHLLNITKLLGIVENAVVALRSMRAATVDETHNLHRMAWPIAMTLREYRTTTLRDFAAAWAARSSAEQAAISVLDQAAYFTRLAAPSGLAGTMLANPFLFAEDANAY